MKDKKYLYIYKMASLDGLRVLTYSEVPIEVQVQNPIRIVGFHVDPNKTQTPKGASKEKDTYVSSNSSSTLTEVRKRKV